MATPLCLIALSVVKTYGSASPKVGELLTMIHDHMNPEGLSEEEIDRRILQAVARGMSSPTRTKIALDLGILRRLDYGDHDPGLPMQPVKRVRVRCEVCHGDGVSNNFVCTNCAGLGLKLKLDTDAALCYGD